MLTCTLLIHLHLYFCQCRYPMQNMIDVWIVTVWSATFFIWFLNWKRFYNDDSNVKSSCDAVERFFILNLLLSSPSLLIFSSSLLSTCLALLLYTFWFSSYLCNLVPVEVKWRGGGARPIRRQPTYLNKWCMCPSIS